MASFSNFGIGIFASYRKAVLSVTAIISFFCTLCFISACAGWSTDSTALKNVAYATIKSSGASYYFGLQNYYFVTSGNLDGYQSYSTCNISICEPCNHASKPAFGLILFSFFLTLVVTGVTIMRAVNERVAYKAVTVIFSFLVLIFTLAGFGHWNEYCFNAIKKADNSAKLSNGFNVAVAGFFFMLFVMVFNLITPVDEQQTGGTNMDKVDGPSNA